MRGTRLRVLVAVLAAACGGDTVTGPVPPSAATQLSLSTQPSGSAQNGAALAVQPAVRLRDAQGRPAAQAGVVVTAALAAGAGVTLSGASATTDATGTATFTGLTLTGTVGSYTLRFSAPNLTPADANPIALTAGAPAALTLATEPSPAAQAGLPLAVQPAVQLRDASGNAAGQAGVTVTASLVSGTAILSSASAVTAASGLATFAGLALSGTAGPYTLRFTAPGLTPVTAAAPTALAAGTATQLVMATQPAATIVNGTTLSVQPAVQLRDAFGNDAAGAGVRVVASVVSGPAGSTLTGDSAVTDAAGRATFTALGLTGAVGGYSLRFSAAGLTSVVAGTVTLTPSAATQIGLTTGPSASTQSGVPMTVQPVVQLRDQSGNAVAQAGIVVSAAVVAGTVTLTNATATTDAAGRAAFAGLTLTGTVGVFQLQFSAPGLGTVTGGTTQLTAGPAAQLALATQPATGATNAVPLTRQPVVRLQDAQGNTVPTGGVVITATLVSGAAALSGASATTLGSGSATFVGLTITGPVGSYTLRFSTAAAGVAPIDAQAPTVLAPGAASQAVLVTQPGASAASGALLAPQPEVQLRDTSGNDVPQAGVSVTATVVGGGASVAGAVVTTSAAGRAAFTALTLSGPTGQYTLRFTAGALPPVDAAAPLALGAGAASRLTLTAQPSTTGASGAALAAQPVVQVRDAAGNAVAAAGVTVTASVVSGPATLVNATATTDAAGAASFSGLAVSALAGSHTLRFSAPGLAGVDAAAPLVLSAGAATRLVLTSQPSTAAQSGMPLGAQPVAQVQDGAGNPVALAGAAVSVSVVSGAATFAGAPVATDAGGTATFTALAVSALAGSYTLRFSATGLAAADAAAPTVVSAGAAARLGFSNPPSIGAQSGVALASQPVVQVRDGAGNAVAGAGVTVTASIVGGGPALTNATAVTVSGGAATFAGLTATGAAGTYVLRFSAPGLQDLDAGFTVSAGPPASLTILTPPPVSATNGQPMAPSVVLVRDASANPVAGVTVTAAAVGNVAVSGGSATTLASGQAQFASLTLTGAASGYNIRYCLSANCSGGGLLTISPTPTHLEPGPPATLVVVAEPSGSAQSGVPLAAQPAVRALDVSGNEVPGVAVTAGVAGATVSGGTVTTDSLGLATFTALAIAGTPAARQLALVAGAASVSRAVTLGVGPVAIVSMTRQPSPAATNGLVLATQPQVSVADATGNPIPGVTVTVSSAPAVTLSNAAATTDAAGVATFAGLGLTGTVSTTYTLTFSAGGVGVDAAGVALAPGAIATVAVSQEPPAMAQNGVPLAPPPAVLVTDAFTAGVPGALVTASLVSGALTLQQATATADGAGIATFTGLTLAGTLGTYTLRFSAGGLNVTATQSTMLAAGPDARLAMVADPSPGAVNGQALAAQPSVRITDAGGQPSTTSGVVVSAAVVSGGVVVGNASATTSNGVATFSGLSLTGLVGTYTLRFSATGLASVTAGTATTLSPGAASRLALLTQPSFSATTGAVFARQPLVQLQDASGNAVSQSGVTVQASTVAAGATLIGTTAVLTDGTGRATFAGLGLATRGTHTMRFTSGSLTAVNAADGTVVAAPLPLATPVIVAGSVLSDSAYVFTVPPGADSLVVRLTGGTGDADLVLRGGEAPDLAQGLLDCYYGHAGNEEVCRIANPAPGPWYIVVYAFFSFSGVTLTATVYP